MRLGSVGVSFICEVLEVFGLEGNDFAEQRTGVSDTSVPGRREIQGHSSQVRRCFFPFLFFFGGVGGFILSFLLVKLLFVSGWLPRKVHEKERKWKMLDIVFCFVLVEVMNVVKCFENSVFFFSL